MIEWLKPLKNTSHSKDTFISLSLLACAFMSSVLFINTYPFLWIFFTALQILWLLKIVFL